MNLYYSLRQSVKTNCDVKDKIFETLNKNKNDKNTLFIIQIKLNNLIFFMNNYKICYF